MSERHHTYACTAILGDPCGCEDYEPDARCARCNHWEVVHRGPKGSGMTTTCADGGCSCPRFVGAS